MANYLISWTTWFEGEQECPWPWMPVDRVKEYRHRTREGLTLREDAAMEIYLSFNPQRITEFERNYRDGIKLVAIISADNDTGARSEIESRFVDAEIVACEPVGDDLYPAVMFEFEKNGHWWKTNAQ